MTKEQLAHEIRQRLIKNSEMHKLSDTQLIDRYITCGVREEINDNILSSMISQAKDAEDFDNLIHEHIRLKDEELQTETDIETIGLSISVKDGEIIVEEETPAMSENIIKIKLFGREKLWWEVGQDIDGDFCSIKIYVEGEKGVIVSDVNENCKTFLFDHCEKQIEQRELDIVNRLKGIIESQYEEQTGQELFVIVMDEDLYRAHTGTYREIYRLNRNNIFCVQK